MILPPSNHSQYYFTLMQSFHMHEYEFTFWGILIIFLSNYSLTITDLGIEDR